MGCNKRHHSTRHRRRIPGKGPNTNGEGIYVVLEAVGHVPAYAQAYGIVAR